MGCRGADVLKKRAWLAGLATAEAASDIRWQRSWHGNWMSCERHQVRVEDWPRNEPVTELWQRNWSRITIPPPDPVAQRKIGNIARGSGDFRKHDCFPESVR
jgi:hypothetical protein